ncbi:MAG: SBBP repeat-containing protein [Candidatus Odinarchaeota archaeon]
MKKKHKFLLTIVISSLLVSTTVALGTPADSISAARSENKTAADSNGLVYSTFFGGSGDDHGSKIVRDSQNNTIIFGITYSSDFPVTDDAYDTTYNGGRDIFVSKWSEDGILLFSTYIGGNADEIGDSRNPGGIMLDNMDNIVICGRTESSDFPVTPGAYDTTFGGSQEAFVFKLSADGSTLVFSTFLGGSDVDAGQSLVLDDTNNIYITGRTLSTDFPITPDAFQKVNGGSADPFVSKLSPDGTELLYSTFLGGSGNDAAGTIVLDDDGDIYVVGFTNSADMAVTPDAYQKTWRVGATDLFAAKLSANNHSELIYMTYIGGSNFEVVGFPQGDAVDDEGNLYITGPTTSSDFPVTTGALDTTFNGDCDGFIVKLSANGSELLYSTFIGGNDRDWCDRFSLTDDGNLCVAGYTDSSDFPVTSSAYDQVLGGERDLFVMKLSSNDFQLLNSSYLGGSGSDGVKESSDMWDSRYSGLLVIGEESVMITGSTDSIDFPVTENAYNTTLNGGNDTFITHLDWNTATPMIDSTTDQTTTGFDVYTGSLLLLAVSTMVWYNNRRRKRNR